MESNKETIILSIETATDLCSVALSLNGERVEQVLSREGRVHASQISVMTNNLISNSGYSMEQLSAIAVSSGPGSYTGLRVGLSFAKGLCYALSKPLISVITLDIMADAATELVEEGSIIVPMIEARRMEVYTANYSSKGERVSDIIPYILEPQSYSELLKERVLYFCGEGSIKAKDIIVDKNAKYLDLLPCAAAMGRIAYKKYLNNNFEDIAYFEPFYLKEFNAGKPALL